MKTEKKKKKLNLYGIATQFRDYFNQPVYWSIQLRVRVRVSLLILISEYNTHIFWYSLLIIYMWECLWSLKVQRHWIPGAKVIGSCELPNMVLGTELQSSEGIVCTLHWWTTSPALTCTFLIRKLHLNWNHSVRHSRGRHKSLCLAEILICWSVSFGACHLVSFKNMLHDINASFHHFR